MSIRNPVYTVFMAGAVIAPNLIVKMGAADKTVIPGAAATDQPLGISVQNITAQIGDRVDVVVGGEYEVKAGGVITRGSYITSDASGQGVVAAPAAGTNNGVIGIATEAAVAGDLFTVQIELGSRQG
jgi:hypothetical protein